MLRNCIWQRWTTQRHVDMGGGVKLHSKGHRHTRLDRRTSSERAVIRDKVSEPRIGHEWLVTSSVNIRGCIHRISDSQSAVYFCLARPRQLGATLRGSWSAEALSSASCCMACSISDRGDDVWRSVKELTAACSQVKYLGGRSRGGEEARLGEGSSGGWVWVSEHCSFSCLCAARWANISLTASSSLGACSCSWACLCLHVWGANPATWLMMESQLCSQNDLNAPIPPFESVDDPWVIWVHFE